MSHRPGALPDFHSGVPPTLVSNGAGSEPDMWESLISSSVRRMARFSSSQLLRT